MKLVVGNFKMNLLKDDVNNYIEIMKKEKFSNVIYCPSSIYLSQFVSNNLVVGSQDVSFSLKGAYTGDISAEQLKSIGVKYTIIGHSERRKYYDDNKYTNEKLKCALENELIPILCIGETLKERENKETNKILCKEIIESFVNINENKLKNVIIAYEPIWSIGTGNIPKNDEIFNIVRDIKDFVFNNYHINLKVLYGGSVNADNINILEEINNVNGYLVGGASLNTEQFKKIINAVN